MAIHAKLKGIQSMAAAEKQRQHEEQYQYLSSQILKK